MTIAGEWSQSLRKTIQALYKFCDLDTDKWVGGSPCLRWLTHHPLCLQPTISPVDIPTRLDQTSKCHQRKLAKKVSQDIVTLDVKSYPAFFFRKYNSIRLAEAMKRWLKELDPNIGIPPEFMTYHLRTQHLTRTPFLMKPKHI